MNLDQLNTALQHQAKTLAKSSSALFGVVEQLPTVPPLQLPAEPPA